MFSAPRLYKFLEHEAQLTQSILTSGLQEIANAELTDYRKGRFYGGAFQLSMGLERLMKLIVILDHMLKNEYKPPSEKYLRIEIGHNLEKLYKRIKNLSIEHREEAFCEESHEYETLKVLSDFAMGARYYNLNKLSTAETTSNDAFVDTDFDDPLQQIIQNIQDVYVRSCQTHVLQRRLHKAFNNHPPHSMARFIQSPLTGGHEMFVDMVQRDNFIHYGRGHFNYLIIRYIRFLVRTLQRLVEDCHSYEEQHDMMQHHIVPYLYEFFPIQYTSKSNAIKRKIWTYL